MPEGTGEGVYIQATAQELDEAAEIISARRVTQARKNQTVTSEKGEQDKFSGDSIRRVYKAIPQKIWMNDIEEDENGQYVRDIRVKIPIEQLKQQMRLST